jgi:hypothetical protein
MSWIVQNLLRNKVSILTEPDLESDEYNNLLVIQTKIKDLYSDGLLSDMDMYILELASDGRPLRDMEETLYKSRITITKTFRQICNRVAYFLGGYFTDEGFLENMRINYRLSSENIDAIKKHMAGQFKHTLMKRKQIDELAK